MLDSEVQLKYSENDQILRNKVTEILLVLSVAEKQGQNLYNPLKQIEGIMNGLQDENLSYLYQRLLNSFQTSVTDQQNWADEYFAFILLLCNLLNETRMKLNQDSLTDNGIKPLVPA